MPQPQDNSFEVSMILFGSTVVILVLAALIILALFINQKRKFRFSQEKATLKNSFDKELLRAQLEIQAQAFESISRELHDNVGTLLSIAIVHLKSVGKLQKPEAQKIEDAGGLLHEAMDSLRDISKSINPEKVQRLGWQECFLQELERIGKTKLFDVHLTQEGNPFVIELSKQVILFRILQETLNNILKHSGARNVFVIIRYTAATLIVSITDDGKGMPERNEVQEGSGLKNMRARAATLPANLDISEAPDGGTAVTIIYHELQQEQV